MTKWEIIRLIGLNGDRVGNNGGILDLLEWCRKDCTMNVTEAEAREFYECVCKKKDAENRRRPCGY